MNDLSCQRLLSKYGQQVNRGVISGLEFINAVLDQFAYIDQVYPGIIPELWAVIPENVRGAFVEAIRGASLGEFRYGPFYRGGGRPMTEDELRRDAELRTVRVRAWAIEFLRWLSEAAKQR